MEATYIGSLNGNLAQGLKKSDKKCFKFLMSSALKQFTINESLKFLLSI